MTSTGEVNKFSPVCGHIHAEVRRKKHDVVVLGRDVKPVRVIWAEDPSGAKSDL
jgi:hypothetical protein